MKQFSLYDILGVLAPGVVVTLGIIALYPDTVRTLNKDFSLGDFGVVVLVSYVIGNLVAALGNFLEVPFWKIAGGRHTDLVKERGASVISARQFSAVETRLRNETFLKADESISTLSNSEWHAMTRQIYAYLGSRKMTQRIDTFNAQYGMNRGIAAGFLALAILTILQAGVSLWRAQLVLLVCTALAAFRMHRFSRYYAAELFRQFIVSPKTAPPAAAKQTEEES